MKNLRIWVWNGETSLKTLGPGVGEGLRICSNQTPKLLGLIWDINANGVVYRIQILSCRLFAISGYIRLGVFI